MRILRAIRSVNPEGGGPIEGITQVSRTLANMGHEVELVSLDAPEDAWARNCPLKVHALGKGGRDFGYAPAYVRWLKRHGAAYGALVVSGLWQFHGLGAWLALRRTGVPYYVFPHGMLDPWFKRAYPLKHLKKWLYWPWAEYRVLRDARAVLFTCEEERRLARESFWLYRCRERVVHYGTAAPSGDAEQQRASFYARFPALRGKRLLLFLGRLHPKKGCDVLVQAFADLVDGRAEETGGAPWHLVLAGPDQAGWHPELEAVVGRLGLSGRVTFTGMLRGDQKWGAFHAADLFVLPSHQENFGIAVVEALSCGVPVIVGSGVNIWREIVGDGAGLVCEPKAKPLARALRLWCETSEEERAQARAGARNCFSRRFEIQRAAESLVAALQG
jgi:glycosyltransferase involved in cell wall biosynthesis